jgi:hypothetical protein
MIKRLSIWLLIALLLAACASLEITATSTLVSTVSLAGTSYPTKTTTNAPRPTSTLLPTVANQSILLPGFVTPEVLLDPATGWKFYNDRAFGLSVQFPSDWQGPDVYQWNYGLRIEVGSDTVYPYGTDRLDRVYSIKNSYYVVVQYSQNNNNWDLEQYTENQPWIKNYLQLLDLRDGESISGIRDLFTRVKPVRLGRFEGLEYIQTLSDTAQTEWFYARRVELFDEQLNNLTIIGSPNNVEILDRANWRDAYRQVDEANLEVFYKILQLISME